MGAVLKFATIILFCYAAYCGLLFIMQRQMLFPRYLMGAAPQAPETIEGGEKIWLATNAGRVESWFVKPPPSAAAEPFPVVILAHGNAELIDTGLTEFKPITHLGVGLLLVEYPGYGRSQGSPSQKSITSTMVAAYDTVVKRPDVDPKRVILYGRSLGGGAVCQLAARRPTAALMLQSSFTSARSFATRYLAPGFLVRDPFDNLAVLKDYQQPVLIIHGRRDEVIPYRHAVALDRAAPRSRLVSYACGHNDCPPDVVQFWQDIATFLTENGLVPPVA